MNVQTTGWRIRAAEENILFFAGFGDWTKDTARAFRAESREIVTTLLRESWSFLCDATDWGFSDTEVQSILKDQIQWFVGKGCRMGCFYTGSHAMNRLMLYSLVVPDSDSCRFRVFPDRKRSVDALGSEGFPLARPQLDGFFRGEGTRN